MRLEKGVRMGDRERQRERERLHEGVGEDTFGEGRMGRELVRLGPMKMKMMMMLLKAFWPRWCERARN